MCELDVHWLSFSPSGEKVLYYLDGELCVFPLSEFVTRQTDDDYEPQVEFCVETPIREKQRAVWSADSSKIAFMTKRDLRIWDLASENLSVVAGNSARSMYIAWSGDDLLVLYDNGEIKRLTSGKPPVTLTTVRVGRPDLDLLGLCAFPEHNIIAVPAEGFVRIVQNDGTELPPWDQDVSVWCPVVHSPNDKVIAMLNTSEAAVVIHNYSVHQRTRTMPGISYQLGGWHPVHGLAIVQAATEGDGYDIILANCQADSPDITCRMVCNMKRFISRIQWMGNELLIVDQNDAVYKISIV